MAERKRPRRTRERILETSLDLFNRFGEPHITTADIANEMGISPGNLYYHFRNKDEIIGELYADFEARILPLFPERIPDRADVEDLWMLLHLLFERMSTHRFLYRDLVDLTTRYPRIGMRFARLLAGGESALRAIFGAMEASGTLRADPAEMAILARNAMLAATHSMAYERLRRPAAGDPDLGRAAYHVLGLIAPYLVGDARELLRRLGRDYL